MTAKVKLSVHNVARLTTDCGGRDRARLAPQERRAGKGAGLGTAKRYEGMLSNVEQSKVTTGLKDGVVLGIISMGRKYKHPNREITEFIREELHVSAEQADEYIRQYDAAVKEGVLKL